METVVTRNGQELETTTVAAVWCLLERLFDNNPLTLHSLYLACTENDARVFAARRSVLVDLGLMGEDGSVMSDIAAVVKSAVVVDGMDLVLRNPVAP